MPYLLVLVARFGVWVDLLEHVLSGWGVGVLGGAVGLLLIVGFLLRDRLWRWLQHATQTRFASLGLPSNLEPRDTKSGSPESENPERNRAQSQAPQPIDAEWVDALQAGFVVVDSTYRIEHINTAACRLLNTPTLQSGAVLPHALVEQLPDGSEPASVRWPRGEQAALHIRVRAVRRATGLYRVLTLHDTTAFQHAKATLRSTDRLLRAIVQTSVAAVAVVNANGTITYANQQAESILGLQSGSHGTWTYNQIGWTLAPIDAETTTPLHDVLSTGTSIRGMRCAITWPDGTRKYLLLNAAPLGASGDVPQVVFSVQDITERHQAAQQLKDEQRFFTAAINSLPGLFFMVDAEGRHQRWNAPLESVTGYTKHELAHRTLADLVVPADASRVREAVHESLADGTGFTLEVELTTQQGTATPYVFTAASLTVDDTPYLAGMGLDITRQREREQALRQARQQADEARSEAERMSALKTSFLTNMSHEIRTPLTTMIGYARILAEDEDPPRRFADHIVNGGQRLLRTLDNILTFSQLDTGAYTLTPTLTDVEEAVRTAIRKVEPDARAAIRVTAPATASPMRLDAQAVTAIATHLLQNAVAFTGADDTITVQIDMEDAGVRLSVADTGQGMPTDYVPHATEPFTQAADGATRPHEGSGLGLAIVQGLVDVMDGTVAIETERGVGTTVSVWIPPAEPDAPS
ncbi:hypothetical protein CRI93_01805 [Longimonas halophila]|uniref:histidine kinase n=1 Tax=Longimonas halophila TaxID=1469170 RepID=A0A2H3PB43_9BACT|nr:PAS domain-containing sensor histidine kinase [Longimonas halophila]PEN09488.1 hypothetical protein CRI93_01805 [Longimonas halophila]